MSLLSLSPLLSSLFISYATRAAAFRSTSTTPPSESDEWKSFHDTITTLQEENEKLKSEARETAARLGAAEASQEELRSQVSSLKEVNMTQEGDIKSLRVQVSEAQHKYDRLVEDSNAEKTALRAQISELQVGLSLFLSSRGFNAVTDGYVVWADTMGTVEGDRC